MPAVTLSRYEFASVHQDEAGRTFLDVPDPIPKRAYPGESRVVAGEGDTPFTIAWKAYRSALDYEQDVRPTGFYDVIAQINEILNPNDPIPIGTVIRVPALQTILGDYRVPPAFYRANTVS